MNYNEDVSYGYLSNNNDYNLNTYLYYNNIETVNLIKDCLLYDMKIFCYNDTICHILIHMLQTYMYSDEELINKIVFNTKIKKCYFITNDEDYHYSFKILNDYKNYIKIYYSDDCEKRYSIPKKTNEKLLHYCANNDVVEIKKLLRKKFDKKNIF